MKILHTSDWHLGQQFHDYDRSPEQQDMLRQITEIVKSELPDALIVCGDVFHTGNPSPRAVEMYNRAILAMHQACPTTQIVVTAGNHDSASRLTVNNDLWDYFSVNVIGHVSKTADERRAPDYDSHIISVCDPQGTTIGYIAAVPYCYESNFPADDPMLPRESRMQAYFAGLSDRIRQINTHGLPVVLMSHTSVKGCDTAGHDNIGGAETHTVDVFGEGFDYVALGHIHTPQDITDRVRYCGTPIPVNFGERFEHSVSIVTFGDDNVPQVRTVPIKNLIPLHDFPTPLPNKDATEDSLDERHRPLPFNEVLQLLSEYPDDKQCYLRIVVKVDNTLTPLANAMVADAVKDKQCRPCYIATFQYRKDSHAGDNMGVRLTSEQLKSKTPLEIARLFFKMKGLELSERQTEIIKTATIEAQQL